MSRRWWASCLTYCHFRYSSRLGLTIPETLLATADEAPLHRPRSPLHSGGSSDFDLDFLARQMEFFLARPCGICRAEYFQPVSAGAPPFARAPTQGSGQRQKFWRRYCQDAVLPWRAPAGLLAGLCSNASSAAIGSAPMRLELSIRSWQRSSSVVKGLAPALAPQLTGGTQNMTVNLVPWPLSPGTNCNIPPICFASASTIFIPRLLHAAGSNPAGNPGPVSKTDNE
jgi:hypothetical protein